jgi:hypothetical protein
MSSPLNNKNIHGVGQITTDATQTVAATIATFTDRAYQVIAKVLATETTDHDEIASYLLVAAFKNDGGTLTQVGSTTNLSTLESTGGWAVDFAVSGTTIQILVTGAADTSISWLVDAEIKNLGQVMASSGNTPNGGIIGEEA